MHCLGAFWTRVETSCLQPYHHDSDLGCFAGGLAACCRRAIVSLPYGVIDSSVANRDPFLQNAGPNVVDMGYAHFVSSFYPKEVAHLLRTRSGKVDLSSAPPAP
ncbi:hypothetical protein M3J09_004036 [Ascochyta lentis]